MPCGWCLEAESHSVDQTNLKLRTLFVPWLPGTSFESPCHNVLGYLHIFFRNHICKSCTRVKPGSLWALWLHCEVLRARDYTFSTCKWFLPFLDLPYCCKMCKFHIMMQNKSHSFLSLPECGVLYSRNQSLSGIML